MKKTEIQPGVIYAFQQSRASYCNPQPIVFLVAPAGEGALYTTTSSYKKENAPRYTKAKWDKKPRQGRGWNSSDVGYPAVQCSWNAAGVITPAQLCRPTLADFEKAADSTQTGVPGTRFTLVTSLAQITGRYEEQLAAWNEQQDKEKQQREREQARRETIRNRADDIVSSLSSFGISACPDTPHGVIGMTLDEAEKLLALLDENKNWLRA